MSDASPHDPQTPRAGGPKRACMLPLLLGLLGLALLAWLGAASLPSIEAKAEANANTALSASHDWAKIDIRDGVAYLVGDAPDPAARAEAFRLVQAELSKAQGFPGVFQSFVDGAPAAPVVNAAPLENAEKNDAKAADTKEEAVAKTRIAPPSPAPKEVEPAPPKASHEAPLAVPDAVAPPPEAWKKADRAKKAKDAGAASALNLAQCRTAIARIGARVPFASSAAGLGPQGRARVARLADIIARCEGVRVSIEGHTDRRGAARANQRLSERRAQAVLTALVAEGAPEPLLIARGFGETRPLRTERSARADAANRRVIIVVRANEGNR